MKKDFNHLVSTFKSSIKTWDYFVNWNKVFANSADLEIVLNKLNFLLGKDDLRGEFYKLYESNPDIVKALPVLLAVRESSLEIYDKMSKESEFYDFSGKDKDTDKYFEFLDKSGLAKLFQRDGIKNLVDYVIGVEVGLDTHGRKNRGGSLMENIVEELLKEFCSINNLELLKQASPKKIEAKWGFNVAYEISARNYDFAVYNPASKRLRLFETNFFNSGSGSKLKAVCGEFRTLNDSLKSQSIDFVWVTDGLGWHTTKRPLEETYNHNDYVFNLSMLEDGVLNELSW